MKSTLESQLDVIHATARTVGFLHTFGSGVDVSTLHTVKDVPIALFCVNGLSIRIVIDPEHGDDRKTTVNGDADKKTEVHREHVV